MTPIVSLAARAAATLGNGWDRAASAARATPRTVRAVIGERRERWVFVIAATVNLLLYLLAIGDLAISPSGCFSTAPLVRFAPDGLFRSRAPCLFEPVIAMHLGSRWPPTARGRR